MPKKFDLIGQRKIRIEKAEQLRRLGINPYPSKSNRSAMAAAVNEDFEAYNDQNVTVAGRLMSWREHGPLVFGHLQDKSGQIQLYIRQDTISQTSAEQQTIGFSELKLLDVGDIVEAQGKVTKTKRGEVSVLVENIRILAKSIRPLPEKWHGIKDKEKLFRQRYLDMIMNPEKRWRFEKTAQIIFAIREFLNNKGFLEVKTPIIQPLYGGGMAKPFKTTVNALGEDYYLAISHELYLKRLITAGFENVYNIAGYFRNEGIDRTHNPEFQMLETMTAFQNYEYNMDLTEELYKYVAEKVFQKTTFTINNQEVDFSRSWPRIKMIDAVKTHTGHDFNQIQDLETAHKLLDEYKISEKPNSVGESMVLLFEDQVEEKLIEPTFIYGHPVEISPLAKQMPNDKRFVERFEVFIGGIEGGDNWTELNDPVELYERFKEQFARGRGGDEEAHPMDVEFLETMEYGMPPTTGLGPGIERLAMMFTETEYIDDVLFFPMMKPAPFTKTQEEIYGEEFLNVDNSKVAKVQDFSKKAVLILNKEVEGWKMTNTIAHLSAYLGHKMDEDKFATRESFNIGEDAKINVNSQYPIVTVVAKPGQMFNLLNKIEAAGLIHLAYIDEMTESSDDNEIQTWIKNKNKSDFNYLGIGIFGDVEQVDKITKSLSLYK